MRRYDGESRDAFAASGDAFRERRARDAGRWHISAVMPFYQGSASHLHPPHTQGLKVAPMRANLLLCIITPNEFV